MAVYTVPLALLLLVYSRLCYLADAAAQISYDTTPLSQEDFEKNPDIAPAKVHGSSRLGEVRGCRAFPGDTDWPIEDDWSRFNDSIGGVLLKPVPAGVVCYPGPYYNETECSNIVRRGGSTHFYLDDPLTVLTEWPQGRTCPPTLTPEGNCTLGGSPPYVVNATNAKHVQAAVNFARNKNLRLTIKGSGHEFGGRNTGAGALGVWTHFLKDFEYVPEYTIGQYNGTAVKYGSGTETWELFNHMADFNFTIPAAGVGTVGVGGGWLSGGGHSTIVSRYGLGSDQVLSLQVVTADGSLLTANPKSNKDLFFALRGGGGATFGVIISVTAKAYPGKIYTTATSLNLFYDSTPDSTIPNNDTFWQGVSLYYRFAQKVVDAGGLGFSYIYPGENDSYQFTTTSTFIDKSPEEVVAFMQPLYNDLAAIGINERNSKPLAPVLWGSRRSAPGYSPGNLRYTSRLFPSTYWADDDLWDASMSAIRKAVEAGYTFHGTLHKPSREIAGWPGVDSAVNPAWRVANLHAMLFYKDQSGKLTAEQAAAAQVDINKYMDTWRALTPGSGAYINEADPAEPNWQDSFFGDLYPRLLRIKRARDPWNLFWAPTTVGSEPWKVVTDYPFSQNGRLCRVW
ncbi:hypothetical protein B0O99DRAFT_570214 [Bisporella sp. PMI_857]|nr:hypothetical protein B0O99DRAFT_570214 [Bisporella sp. PMI_857]